MNTSKNNKQKTIQPKLEVGAQNDSFENEADNIAQEVVSEGGTKQNLGTGSGVMNRMSSATPDIQKMSGGDQGSKMSSPAKEKLENNSGNGEGLKPDMQQEMESGMGVDFSNVKIHNNAGSHQLSQEMGAKAFTYGSDIYFNQGQYNTTTQEGKQLLAHELVHTVQQGYSSTRKIQKKILLGANDHAYSEEFAKGLTPLGLQIYNSMIASATEFSFADEPALKAHIETEEKLRNALINIATTEDANCGFDMKISTESSQWKPVDAYGDKKEESKNSNYAIGLTDDKRVLPSDAIKSVFSKDSNSTFDCSAMMMANVYGAMSQALGPDAFNKLYAGDKRKDLIISPEFVYFKDEKSDTFKDHPLLESGMYERVKLTSIDELIPGDWVYFMNSTIYLMIIGAAGPWMGEHAAYVGKNGEEHMFKGFGLPAALSHDKMKEELSRQSFLAMRYTDMAVWKAVEKWAPTPADRTKMFLALVNARLVRFIPVEKQADGYKVSPDSFCKKLLLEQFNVNAEPVTLPLTEFDPENNIYTEGDIDAKSFTGQLPGLDKEVWRPRVDKMK